MLIVAPKKVLYLLIMAWVWGPLSCNLVARDAQPLKIVTTFPVLKSWVEAIGGDSVEIYSLVGSPGSVHNYEPLPKDIKKLKEAELIVGLGLGLEYWLDDLIRSAGSTGTVVFLSDGMPRKEVTYSHGDHSHSVYDPHLWMDPDIAVMMVTALAEILAEKKPGASDSIYQRTEEWTWEVRDADYEIQQKWDSFPSHSKKILTHHQNLDYWAEHYGFEVLGSVLASVSSHHEDPSAREMAHLVNLLNESGRVLLIFSDNENPKLLSQLSRETGDPLIGPLYVETVPELDSGENTYVVMMQENASLILRELESSEQP